MTTSHSERQKLIEEGQALVYSLATRAFRSIPVRVDYEDLVAYGEIGLGEAARDFDPDKNTQFTTFAFYRIKGAIYDGISTMSWASRAAYRRARRMQLINEKNQTANETDEVQGKNHCAAEKLADDISGKLPGVSFASEVEQSDELFEDPAASAPVVVAQREVIDRLVKLVSELPIQEQTLIHTIYFDDTTLQDASVRLGISKSWASRIHSKVLEQLAHSLRFMGAGD